LRVCELFKFHDVFLYFVNPQLDSRDPQFERLIIEYASEDQNFLHKLRHAVRRGQKDRARKGLNPGGFRYGYTTVLVPDTTRRGTISRPAAQGTRILLLEEEAAAVRQVYLWARDGRNDYRLKVLVQHHLEHNGGFEEPRDRRPEFSQRIPQWMSRCVRHRVGTVSFETAARLRAG
jgi:hypothetical protein